MYGCRVSAPVILQTMELGRLRTQHWAVDTLKLHNTIRSLVLRVNQEQPSARVQLYVDCHDQGAIHTPVTLREMVEQQDSSAAALTVVSTNSRVALSQSS